MGSGESHAIHNMAVVHPREQRSVPVKVSKRALTGALAIPLIASLAGAFVFQVSLRHAGAEASFETLTDVKTIDDDHNPIDDAGAVASNQDNGAAASFANAFVNDPCLDPAAGQSPAHGAERDLHRRAA
jgi:hypothetical protein